MINPHNPEFITKRPWYLGESGPSLVHHSKQKVDAVLTMKKADELVQQRWATKKKVATGYRKVRLVLVFAGLIFCSSQQTSAPGIVAAVPCSFDPCHVYVEL